MNQVILSPCTIVKFAQIYPLFETYPDIFNTEIKRQMIHDANNALDEEPLHPTMYIAQHEGSTLGFIGFHRDIEEPSWFNLFSIIIKRGYQGQGIGTKLFLYAQTQIRRLGAQEVHVHIKYAYPVHTRSFYKKLGFSQQFDEGYTGASDEDNLLFVKILSNH